MSTPLKNEMAGRRFFLKSALTLALGISCLFSFGGGSTIAADDPTARARWNALPPEQKDLMKKRWAEFQALKAGEQNELRAALEKFNSLTEEQRQHIMKNYDHWKTLSKEQQDNVQAHYSEWKTMSEAERTNMRDQLKNKEDSHTGSPAK